MILRTTGTVTQILSTRPGLQEIEVRLEGELSRPDVTGHASRRAINLTTLNGKAVVGDRVELNTAAVEMDLGTGGWDYVVTVLGRETVEETPPGHIIKLRYTPLQTPVLSVEAPESPHHSAVCSFETLDETPVVCFELHSQLPAIACAIERAIADTGRRIRVVYIMTDGAALPIAFSKSVNTLKERGMLTCTITAGQAFGGDMEAVNIYSALAAAYTAAKADIILIGQGPGTVGTGTPLGFSGVDQGISINAAASLGGTPIFVPRISFSDKRERHIGLSHHTITNLTRVVRAHVMVPIPRLGSTEQRQLGAALQENGITEKHDVITVDSEYGLKAAEDSGILLSTMGRSLSDERAFFLAACAAGLLAAQVAETRPARLRS